MIKLSCPAVLSVMAFALVHLFAAPAMAQSNVRQKAAERVNSAVSRIQNACKSDARKFCDQVTPGGGRIALCMIAHEDKVSDECYNTILDVGDEIRLSASNVIRAAQACAADISKHCAAAKRGNGGIASCLIASQSGLSRSCKAEIAGLKVRMGNR